MTLEPGLDIIFWLQARPGWFLSTMRWVSIVGRGGFYLLAAVLVFWAWDRRLGARLFAAITFGGIVNSLLKMGLHMPRPYWLDSRVRPLELHSSFGMPSGHAQTAVLAWGEAAWSVGRVWAWIGAVAVLLVIGLSRVVLGVHSPAQVLVGWFVGFVLLAGCIAFERKIVPVLQRWKTSALVVMIMVAAAAVLVAGIMTHRALQGWIVPEAWAKLAGKPFGCDPLPLKDLFRSVGALLGFALGAIWTARAGRWILPDGWLHRTVEVLVGSMGLGLVLVSGASMRSSVGTADLWYLGNSLLAGFWVSGLTPLLAGLLVGFLRPDQAR